MHWMGFPVARSTLSTVGLTAMLALMGMTLGATAQEVPRRHASAHARFAGADPTYRPLTIGRHPGAMVRNGPHAGLIVGRNEVYAPGGFSAHGYGPRPLTEAELRAAQNADVRYRTGGVYGYGLDGLGGIGFGDGLESGYNNPSYGNSFNRYVGYNGVPTDLAFGPAFGNRYIADHEPEFASDPDRQPLFSSSDFDLSDDE